MKSVKRNCVILKANYDPKKRLMIAVPITGLLRAEWAMSRWGQTIPCNWSQSELYQWLDMFSPLGYLVADARNAAVDAFMKGNFEWLFFIDHDVVMPPNCFQKWNQYMLKGDIPIWGGLYFTKSVPSEPLTYRGLGNSYYANWKIGDKVWLDGMGLGCNMLHRSIIENIYKDSEEYQIGHVKVRRVFETPLNVTFDPETLSWNTSGGTEDLTFYNRLKKEKYYEKGGWSKFQKKEHPLLCDTSVFCKHIDWDGTQYPARGEERQFVKEKK